MLPIKLSPLGKIISKKPTARDYVQNGLIAMWDGVENAGLGVHDKNATVWKDLIGNNNLIAHGNIENKNGDNYIWLGDVYYTGESNNLINTISNGNFTLELVVHSNSAPYVANANAIFVLCSSVDYNDFSQRVCVISNTGQSGYENNAFSAIQINESSWDGTRSAVRTGIGFNEDIVLEITSANKNINYYKNTSLMHNIQFGPLTSYNKVGFAIGKYLQNMVEVDLKAYCIRVYSRTLSSDEISANYAIDKVRFNL